MPIIQVNIIEGRTPEQLRALIEELTLGAVRALDAPIESVRVMLNEMPPTHFAAGNVTMVERRAAAAAAGAGAQQTGAANVNGDAGADTP